MKIIDDKLTFGIKKSVGRLTGLIVFLLLGIMTLTMITLPASAGEVEKKPMVNINQENSEKDIQALGIRVKEIEDSKMVGLRQLGDKFDWEFGFSTEDKTVLIYGEERQVELNIDKALYNDQELDSKPIITDGRTYISFDLLKKLISDLENIELELLATLLPAKTIVEKGEKINTKIELYNISDKEVRINYQSGKLYDLYLMYNKTEVWRWSDGKIFTMALNYKDLQPGEKLQYKEEVPFAEDYESGQYILSGEIATKTSIPLPEVEIEVK